MTLIEGIIGFGFFWGFVFGFVITLLVMFSIGYSNKTRSYRKVLTDMYVIGKLKQYAKKENIDLIGLLKEFKQLRKILREDLLPDKVIESEISEKITQVDFKEDGD